MIPAEGNASVGVDSVIWSTLTCNVSYNPTSESDQFVACVGEEERIVRAISWDLRLHEHL